MQFDLALVPFSRFGSYMAISQLAQGRDHPPGLYLRSVCNGFKQTPVLRIEMFGKDGKELQFTSTASPAKVTLIADGGVVEIVFATPDAVRIRSKGAHVRLTPAFRGGIEAFRYGDSDTWRINAPKTRHKYLIRPLSGTLSLGGAWDGKRSNGVVVNVAPGDGGVCEVVIDEYESAWEPKEFVPTLKESQAEVEKEWEAFLSKMPSVPEKYATARELASYVDWSCTVAPRGVLTRRAMYMSKNWMCAVWSWDHCFNAMALAEGHPELAWDQFMLMFDLQHEQGALPDMVDDVKPLWAYCKPPIHGWTLARLMATNEWFAAKKRLTEVYAPLCKWTEWWLTYRDPDGTGLCEYHHGNDSGWDNSTAFMAGVPLVGPDLAAFLVIQMELLSDIAGKVGKTKDSSEWKNRAAAMKRKLTKELWRGDRFVSVKRPGGHVAEDGDSLINFIPVVLGKRLPKDIREKVVAGLSQEGRFLTQHGFATENTRSPYYDPDGYWRGPIWAPSTMIIIDGLAAAGAKDLARKAAARFCDTCRENGFAENYDALTGVLRRDPAYTWTSSAFLCLAHEYL
jgi:hypothetical protein